jgi:Ca2+-binding EF-hand superfamily protein
MSATEFGAPTEEERELAWRRWDVDGDGTLDLGEVVRGLELSFSFTDRILVDRAFRATDNGDGRISRREFRLLLAYLAFFSRLRHQFTQLDVDGSGELSLHEFQMVRRAGLCIAAVATTTAAATASAPGAPHLQPVRISSPTSPRTADWQGVESLGLRLRGGQLITPERATAEFRELDIDASGSVSFDEFCVWAAHNRVGRPPHRDESCGRSETPERLRQVSELAQWAIN